MELWNASMVFSLLSFFWCFFLWMVFPILCYVKCEFVLKLFIVWCTNVMASIRSGKHKVDNGLPFFFKSNWNPNKSCPSLISSKFRSMSSFEANSNKSKVELNLKSMHNNHVCNLCAQLVWPHLFLVLYLTCLKSTCHQTKEISFLSKKPKKNYVSHNFRG
jgi:hypothetical protein